VRCILPATRNRDNKTRSRCLASWLVVMLPAASYLTWDQTLRAQGTSTCCDQSLRGPSAPPEPRSDRDRWDFGAQVGFALENGIPHNVSHIALLIAQPEVGFVVRNFRRSPVRRFEVVNQGIFGNAVHPGGRLTGYALLLRLDGKNYGRVSPFVDVGGGVQHTTLAKRAPELSGPVQFTPQAGVGIQYSFNSRGALMLEYRYMHMSNAGLQSPNHGFNGSMLSLGFRWLRWPHPSH
jgi:hypothetical protein